MLGQRVVEVLRGEGEWMKRWGWRGSVGEEEGKEWMGDGSRGGGGE